MIPLLRKNVATVLSAGFTLVGVAALQFGFIVTKVAQAMSYPTCGGATYNPSTEACCNGSIYNMSTEACCGNMAVYTVATQACCGSSFYNLSTEACCVGSTRGPQVYNKNASTCCVSCGEVFPKTGSGGSSGGSSTSGGTSGS